MTNKNYNYRFFGGEFNGMNLTYREAWELSGGQLTEDLSDLRRQGERCHRAELDNQPKIFGYMGPMYDGKDANGVINLRYETKAVYAAMSV